MAAHIGEEGTTLLAQLIAWEVMGTGPNPKELLKKLSDADLSGAFLNIAEDHDKHPEHTLSTAEDMILAEAYFRQGELEEDWDWDTNPDSKKTFVIMRFKNESNGNSGQGGIG